MKKIIILLMFLIPMMGFSQSSSKRMYFDGDGLQVMLTYKTNLGQILSLHVSGKRGSEDKLVWLNTVMDKNSPVAKEKGWEYYLTDENKVRYRITFFTDAQKATITKFNATGQALRAWDLKGRHEEAKK